MILTRRRFVTGLIAAPAVIAASRLMPVRGVPMLWADRTIYVNGGFGGDWVEDGSFARPFRTVQKAMNLINHDLDLNGHTVTLNCQGTIDANVDLRAKAAIEVTDGNILEFPNAITISNHAPNRVLLSARRGATAYMDGTIIMVGGP
jgi:hypothetical protein